MSSGRSLCPIWKGCKVKTGGSSMDHPNKAITVYG